MKKLFIAVMACTLLLSSCGAPVDETPPTDDAQQVETQQDESSASDEAEQEPEAEPEEETFSLVGRWEQSNKNSEDSYQEAIITEDTITVNWVAPDSVSLYWAGSYDNSNASFSSENDTAQTSVAMLASGDATKDFALDGEVISYEVSAFGETMTVKLEKTGELTEEDLQASEPAEQDDAESPFVDGVLTVDNATFEILRYEVIEVGEAGNEYGDAPVLAIWYNTTNTKDGETVTPMDFMWYFKAVQDNDPNMVNELDVGMHPDNALVDNQMVEIKLDGTVENAMAYELSDTTTPVQLIASDMLGMEEYGSMTFDLQ